MPMFLRGTYAFDTIHENKILAKIPEFTVRSYLTLFECSWSPATPRAANEFV